MEVFIIPLLAFAVWVLQYVFKPPEDKKAAPPQNRPRPPAQQRPGADPGRPRRPVNDLDRFLEETRRRKQQDERRPVVMAELAPEGTEDRGEAVERERKAASQPKPPPRPARPQPPPARRVPMAEPLAPVVLMAEPVESSRMVQRDVAIPSVAATVARRSGSPILGQVVKLLRGPQGSAVALVMHEILEPPVALRRR